MSRNIIVETLRNTPVAEQEVEIVERKGIGHPDYICDALAERIALSLSREYIDKFGRILHFNIDKGLLVAGKVERLFGGGRVKEPMEFIIGDRAVFEAGGKRIDIEDLVIRTSRDWLSDNIRNMDPERDVHFRVVLAPGSEELISIFDRKSRILGANDTSAGVGYAPLTPTEVMVLSIERYLNSMEFKRRFSYTGEDVKVMALRRKRNLTLTIAMPLLCKSIGSEDEYFDKKEEIQREVESVIDTLPSRRLDPHWEEMDGLEHFKSIEVHINTLDKRGKGLEGVYLSLLGTSAEDADSGQIGRGNKVNGITSLNRPMATEAAAGKNPVSHVGKIYNILSHVLAQEIYREIDNIKEVYVWLLSQIGQPIDRPALAAVQIVTDEKIKGRFDEVRDIVDFRLSHIEDFCGELIKGVYPVC